MTRQQLLDEAMTLVPEEREALAEELLRSISDAEQERIDEAWLAVARERSDALTRGRARACPIEEVLHRVAARTNRP